LFFIAIIISIDEEFKIQILGWGGSEKDKDQGMRNLKKIGNKEKQEANLAD